MILVRGGLTKRVLGPALMESNTSASAALITEGASASGPKEKLKLPLIRRSLAARIAQSAV